MKTAGKKYAELYKTVFAVRKNRIKKETRLNKILAIFQCIQNLQNNFIKSARFYFDFQFWENIYIYIINFELFCFQKSSLTF